MIMSIPKDSLEKLRCSDCQRYLSYFPIYLAQDQTTKCGRCPVPEGGIRETIYECLARSLKFPCIYANEGCLESMLPRNVPVHEEICLYRIIPCPTQDITNCFWQGTFTDLVQHCEDVHPTFILKNNEFEMDLLNSYEQNNFVTFEDDIFTLRHKFDAGKNILECWVVPFGHTTGCSYQVVLKNGNRTLSHEFPVKPVAERETSTEIAIDTARNNLKDPAIMIGSIKIITNPLEAKTSIPNVNIEMLSELECPVCFELMTPPIYLCDRGHSICSECKSSLAQCPLCKTPIVDRQNFTLERMSSLMIFPCKFVEDGCSFASQPNLMKDHQKFCKFGPQECPLKDYADCNWKGPSNKVVAHVRQQHHDNFLDVDKVSVFIDDDYFQGEDCDGFLLKRYNKLFKLHFLYVEEKFYWAMQLVGPSEESAGFQFEIDVIDNANNGQRMFFRSLCSPLTDKDSCFLPENKFIFINVNQIQCFIAENELSYRVHIKEQM